MKRKVLSVLLASAMVASLAACGEKEPATTQSSAPAESSSAAASSEAGSEAPAEAYQLDSINMVINGTLTATVDNGQADFEKQWEDAVMQSHSLAANVSLRRNGNELPQIWQKILVKNLTKNF